VLASPIAASRFCCASFGRHMSSFTRETGQVDGGESAGDSNIAIALASGLAGFFVDFDCSLWNAVLPRTQHVRCYECGKSMMAICEDTRSFDAASRTWISGFQFCACFVFMLKSLFQIISRIGPCFWRYVLRCISWPSHGYGLFEVCLVRPFKTDQTCQGHQSILLSIFISHTFEYTFISLRSCAVIWRKVITVQVADLLAEPLTARGPD
jgi:hypothetical protein